MLSFTKLESGCVIPNSHAPNRDGYHRVSIGNPHNRKTYMLHRAVYEARHGELPKGYEVDHLCKCRQCCNPDHLEAKDRTTHLVETNISRYNDIRMEARIVWEESGRTITGTELGAMFNRSFGIACKWIRDWKKEEVDFEIGTNLL
jgi:hypothetical protein